MKALGLLPYLIAFILIVWFMVIRPQQRQRQEMQSMLKDLQVGAEVMLTSGIFGRVTEIDDDAVHVQVAEGAVIRVIRGAIARVIPQHGDEHDPEHDTPEIEPGNDAGSEEH